MRKETQLLKNTNELLIRIDSGLIHSDSTLYDKLKYLINIEPNRNNQWSEYLRIIQNIEKHTKKHNITEFMLNVSAKIQTDVQQGISDYIQTTQLVRANSIYNTHLPISAL
jgi:hypothetical protein